MKLATIKQSIQIRMWSSLILKFIHSKDGASTSIRALVISMLILLLNMITGMITARVLGPAGRGDLAAIVLCAEMLAFTMTFGIPAALLYNMKRKPEEAAKLYISALMMTGVCSIAALGIGFTIIPYWLHSYSSEIIAYAQMAVLVTPVILITFIHKSMFRARNEFHIFNRLRMLLPLVTILMLITLFIGDWMTPLTAAMSYLLPYCPFVIWNMVRFVRMYKLKWNNAFNNLKDSILSLYHYGMRAYGVDFLGNIALYIDRVIVVGMLSPAHFGIYVVAVSLSRMVNIFQHSISLVLFPKASELTVDKIIILTTRVFRISNLVALVGVLILLWIAPIVLTLLYGEEFAGALNTFRVLVLEVMIGGINGCGQTWNCHDYASGRAYRLDTIVVCTGAYVWHHRSSVCTIGISNHSSFVY